MPPTKSFLKFNDVTAFTKTRRLEIIGSWDNVIGEIKWYVPWRTYCFFPGDNTIFDPKCLAEIQTKIKELMEARREPKENENRTAMGT